MSSVGEVNEASQGEGELLYMESSLSISHLLNDATQNRGDLYEMAPLTSLGEADRPVSSAYAQGGREAASFILALYGEEDNSETQGGGFKDGGNSLVEDNGDSQMSPHPAGCNSFFFCRNDESASEGLDPSSEGWMDDIPSTSDDLNALGKFDCYFDISELNNLLESDMDQSQIRPRETLPPQMSPRWSSHLIGEGKRGKAVLYPFGVVKPCSVQGDVTLTDINRRIWSSSGGNGIGIPHGKHSSSQPIYTSAFTGKPVISRTKIHTEGNGSVIITRTRG